MTKAEAKSGDMEKKLLISIDENQTRIALLDGGKLDNLFIEQQGEERIAGSIYKGEVRKVLPGMQAAFVDIGLEKDGFLSVSDVVEGIDEGLDERFSSGSIESRLKKGQKILVQVLREPIGTKGARLSSYISLPGRYLVLMPTVAHLGVSRKIGNDTERKRLRSILHEIAPSGKGFIVRTAGEGKGKREFRSDIRYLLRTWAKVERSGRKVRAPKLVHEELDVLQRVVRDILDQDVSGIMIDHRQGWARLRKFVRSLCPDLRVEIEFYKEKEPLFEVYEIEKEIDTALSREVRLKSGGCIVIEQTEALVSIDVNTGRFTGKVNLESTALKTNLEAASEIARQLRLRDMGGIIIIDFIDMESGQNQKKVVRRLEESVKNDRAKTTILELTELGLVEMTRQRVRRSLSRTLYEACPYCKGSGSVKSVTATSIKVQRKLKQICQVSRERSIVVKVHTRVAERLLGEDRRKLSRLERQFRRRFVIEGNPTFHIEEIQFP